MEATFPTNKNLFFAPINIEPVTETMVEVSVFAKNFFNHSLGEHPYFIEQECYATCEGDFRTHAAFNPDMIGHSPSPQMLRYDGSGQDKIATTFTLGLPIGNGSLTWAIPMYIFDVGRHKDGEVSKEKTIYDVTKPKTINPPEKTNPDTDLPEIDFEAMEGKYKLIAQIEVVQRFVLENGVLTMSKNGADLLRLDLKQYPHVFQTK